MGTAHNKKTNKTKAPGLIPAKKISLCTPHDFPEITFDTKLTWVLCMTDAEGNRIVGGFDDDDALKIGTDLLKAAGCDVKYLHKLKSLHVPSEGVEH